VRDWDVCRDGVSLQQGLQKLNEIRENSIIGSKFTGNLIEETNVGPYTAVIPTFRGRGFVSGINQIVLDPRDPWPHGFFVGERNQWGTEL
jgi:proline racemase